MTAALTLASEQERRNRSLWRASQACAVGVAVVLAVVATRSMTVPFWFTATLLLAGAAVVVVQPRIGLHLCVGFALLADNQIAPWYPFVKNGSSRESIFFLDDTIGLSPLEFFLMLTTAVWLLSHLVERRAFHGGTLIGPLAAFTGFVAVGFAYGLATGGDRIVALWEVRPLLYLPLVYLLATNLFTERRHYVQLMWVAMGALVAEGVYGLHHLINLSGEVVQQLEGRSLVEHSAALHMNTMFVLAVAARVFRSDSTALRLLLPALCVPALVVYIESERRSAFVAFGAALLVLAALLHRQRRQAFWLIVPAATVVFALYVAAFWNQQTALAYPAQSIKTIIAPEALNAQDRSSDLYRQIETYDLLITIRSNPVLGIGFGQKFLRPVPLPDISWVPFWEYIPHNSVLWIWTQAGLGGIVAFLYLVGSATSRGLSAAQQAASGTDASMLTSAALLFPMFAIFAYVDMAWDAQSTVYLGIAAALIGNIARLRCQEIKGAPDVCS